MSIWLTLALAYAALITAGFLVVSMAAESHVAEILRLKNKLANVHPLGVTPFYDEYAEHFADAMNRLDERTETWTA